MRHFRDTLEWTSGDTHSIHAVEESIEYILYYRRTDAEEQLTAPQRVRGSECGQSELSEKTKPALQTGHTLHVIVLQ